MTKRQSKVLEKAKNIRKKIDDERFKQYLIDVKNSND